MNAIDDNAHLQAAQTDSRRAREWLFSHVDGAETAGEFCGRALVVIAAEK